MATCADTGIERLIFAADTPAPADIAIVFGTQDDHELRLRTEHSAELFHLEYVPLLLMTGRGRERSRAGESIRMRDIAMELGVPERAILTENGSRDTVENVEFSLELLRGRGRLDSIESVLLVSSPWHMGRCLRTMRQHAPASWELRCCPPEVDYTVDNWSDDPTARPKIEHEIDVYRRLSERGLL